MALPFCDYGDPPNMLRSYLLCVPVELEEAAREVATPTPTDHEVLIKLQAVAELGVNRAGLSRVATKLYPDTDSPW
jgi:hypothetical protein